MVLKNSFGSIVNGIDYIWLRLLKFFAEMWNGVVMNVWRNGCLRLMRVRVVLACISLDGKAIQQFFGCTGFTSHHCCFVCDIPKDYIKKPLEDQAKYSTPIPGIEQSRRSLISHFIDYFKSDYGFERCSILMSSFATRVLRRCALTCLNWEWMHISFEGISRNSIYLPFSFLRKHTAFEYSLIK